MLRSTWWFYALLAAPALIFGGWWFYAESGALPLKDGQYWCSEHSQFGYHPGSDFAVDVEYNEVKVVRPFDVGATKSGYDVSYGKKVDVPEEISRKGGEKFDASIEGYNVECELHD